MKHEDTGIFMCGVLIFLAGLAIGAAITEPSFQRQAVKAGVGEWVATESGGAEFRFRTK